MTGVVADVTVGQNEHVISGTMSRDHVALMSIARRTTARQLTQQPPASHSITEQFRLDVFGFSRAGKNVGFKKKFRFLGIRFLIFYVFRFFIELSN